MATKTRKPKAKVALTKEVELKSVAAASPANWETVWDKLRIPAILVLLLLLFWYATNSWPVVALVNYRPIWRWQYEQAMTGQVGKQVIENLIVEQLIRDELANKKVVVSTGDVDGQINKIKTEVGSDESFQQALAFQGMTEASLREQITMQMGLEKLVEPSTDSAKISEDIYTLVQKLRSQARVWEVPDTTK
ncbi:MAG: SurA N-terminal domain-containing protein [bacterium]|nr:SurA N-terminal domain-containing protein [bacterium]